MFLVVLQHAFVVVSAVFLAALLCLSIYDSWRVRSRGWTMTEEFLGECTRCRLMFLVSRYETVVRCPRCGTLVQTPGRSGSGGRGKVR
jgi:ribosomal protein S27E